MPAIWAPVEKWRGGLLLESLEVTFPPLGRWVERA